MTKRELQKAIDKADKVLGEGLGPLDVICPLCHVRPGALCYNPDGRYNAGSHVVRVEVADKLASEILELGETARRQVQYRENAQLSMLDEIAVADQTSLFLGSESFTSELF